MESNIQAPYDSELLYDVTRVLAIVLAQEGKEVPELAMSFADHRLRAKRRLLQHLFPVMLLFRPLALTLPLTPRGHDNHALPKA